LRIAEKWEVAGRGILLSMKTDNNNLDTSIAAPVQSAYTGFRLYNTSGHYIEDILLFFGLPSHCTSRRRLSAESISFPKRGGNAGDVATSTQLQPTRPASIETHRDFRFLKNMSLSFSDILETSFTQPSVIFLALGDSDMTLLTLKIDKLRIAGSLHF